MLMRLARFLIGALLLPVCWIVSLTVSELMVLVQPTSTSAIPPSVFAFGGGFLLWVIIFLVLPRPIRTYVLAHELTHALWGVLRGARVKNIRVSKDQGSVTLTKSDFLITLAPYFFPLYTFIVIVAYYILSIFIVMHPYELIWLGLVGFTWGFHFCFTITTLMQTQSDIKECGYLFSYTIIYMFNVFGITLWVVLVSDVELGEMMGAFSEGISRFMEQYRYFSDVFKG
jgi:hypothetical protein